jgi:PST family polysaccharide transporter
LKGNFLFVLLSYLVVVLTCFLFDYLFRGLEKMEVITKRFVVMRGIAVLLTFFFVKSDSDILWIPILDILGSIIAVILVFIQLHKMKIMLKFHSSNDILKKIKDSTVVFLNTVAVTAFMALNTIVIGIYLPIKEVAFWSLSLQIISAGQAFYTPIIEGIYPRMIISKDFNIIQKVLKIFIPIIILGCIFTYFAAPIMVQIIGGIQYIDATSTLQALIPVLFFGFTTMLFGWPTLGVLGKAKDVTFCTMITAFLQILGLIVLVDMGKLTILNISWLRGITEFINTCLRLLYIWAYRYKGDIDCGKWTRN